MKLSSRLALILFFLAAVYMTKREFEKPSLESQLETLGRQMRSEGKLGDFEGATLAHLKERDIAYQNPSALFALIVVTSLVGGFCIFKIILPLFKDGLDGAFADTSNQTGWVKAKVLLSKEKYPQAIAELQKYMISTPDDKRGVLEIARIQAELLNDSAAAVSTLSAAAESRATDPAHAAEYLYRIVEIYRTAKDTAKVDQWGELLMQRHPSSPQAGQAANLMQQAKEAAWLAKQQGS